jgi:hypothetical protein
VCTVEESTVVSLEPEAYIAPGTAPPRTKRPNTRSPLMRVVLVLAVAWALIGPITLVQQVRGLRSRVNSLLKGAPDFCFNSQVTGRVHFVGARLTGKLMGLPPDALIDLRWVDLSGTAYPSSRPRYEVQGRAGPNGVFVLDGDYRGAILLGTMATVEAVGGRGFLPGYAC